MGTIREGEPARDSTPGWATLTDEPGESSGNFMAAVVASQDNARVTTPGTLSYTPAATWPVQNVAPWNSWRQPNCAGAPADSPGDGPTVGEISAPAINPILIGLGVLTGLAALKYIFDNKGR